MKRVAWLSALVLMLGASLPTQAQTVEFVSPASDIVRGTVPIQVDLGTITPGSYVMFYLGAADQPLAFQLSTLADRDGLYTFTWDTQQQDAPVADGEYQVLAVAYSAGDQAIGQGSRTLEVQNTVPTSQLPAEGILLRHNLTPGRLFNYQGRSESVDVSSEDDSAEPGIFRTSSAASWRQLFIRREPGGTAQVRNTVTSFRELTPEGLKSSPLDLERRFLTFGLTPQGDVIPRKAYSDIDFPYGELSLELPTDPVSPGDTWRSRMRILYEPGRSKTSEVIGRHTFKGVQWFNGERCAIIETTFEGGPYRVAIESKEPPMPEGGAMGGMPGSGPMMGAPGMGGPMGGPMGPGMAPGMGDPAMMGMSGGMAGMGGMGGMASGMLRREATILVKNGKRTTYFAYQAEVGRVMRVEETQEQHITMASEKPQETAMGGMGGMGG
ncbi:MAG TPA: hypothetical protein DCZ72_12995, partial [Armatimonadetes bacterium]|nr:hypothetical protein [Armatimonadota bacterium]